MGSFFLHDDYRLPEIASLSFKKEANGSIGIFGNNPCFASIKKELGFYDENQEDSTNEAFDDAKSRSSPVVERLILQEIQSDIADYASMLNIAVDPEQWSTVDTRKWLSWLSQQYQLPDISECLSFDGPTLCNLTEQELVLLTGSQDTGLKVTAQLDIWKNACRMVPSAGFYHFQQQQAMDYKLGSDTRPADSNSPRVMAVSCSWSTPFVTSTSGTPSYTNLGYDSRQTNYIMPSNGQFPCQSSTSNINPYQSPEIRHPRPTIPLDRYQSYRSVSNTTYPQGNAMHGAYNQHTLVDRYPTQTTVPSNHLSPNGFVTNAKVSLSSHYPAASGAILNQPVQPHIQECSRYPQTRPAVTRCHTTETDLEELSKADSISLNQSSMDSTKVPKMCSKTGLSNQRKSKHPIHLWEFLKELLHEKKDCIQWIDEEKGVFKIFNSQQVAKFWGERKNRPAMNYDKLSRSIRQYYKKGIIKKTSQGKRLVYQFCESYL